MFGTGVHSNLRGSSQVGSELRQRAVGKGVVGAGVDPTRREGVELGFLPQSGKSQYFQDVQTNQQLIKSSDKTLTNPKDKNYVFELYKALPQALRSVIWSFLDAKNFFGQLEAVDSFHREEAFRLLDPATKAKFTRFLTSNLKFTQRRFDLLLTSLSEDKSFESNRLLFEKLKGLPLFHLENFDPSFRKKAYLFVTGESFESAEFSDQKDTLYEALCLVDEIEFGLNQEAEERKIIVRYTDQDIAMDISVRDFIKSLIKKNDSNLYGILVKIYLSSDQINIESFACLLKLLSKEFYRKQSRGNLENKLIITSLIEDITINSQFYIKNKEKILAYCEKLSQYKAFQRKQEEIPKTIDWGYVHRNFSTHGLNLILLLTFAWIFLPIGSSSPAKKDVGIQRIAIEYLLKLCIFLPLLYAAYGINRGHFKIEKLRRALDT